MITSTNRTYTAPVRLDITEFLVENLNVTGISYSNAQDPVRFPIRCAMARAIARARAAERERAQVQRDFEESPSKARRMQPAPPAEVSRPKALEVESYF